MCVCEWVFDRALPVSSDRQVGMNGEGGGGDGDGDRSGADVGDNGIGDGAVDGGSGSGDGGVGDTFGDTLDGIGVNEVCVDEAGVVGGGGGPLYNRYVYAAVLGKAGKGSHRE